MVSAVFLLTHLGEVEHGKNQYSHRPVRCLLPDKMKSRRIHTRYLVTYNFFSTLSPQTDLIFVYVISPCSQYSMLAAFDRRSFQSNAQVMYLKCLFCLSDKSS